MLNDELIISIRNLFLIQLVILTLAPEKFVPVYQGLHRIWKSFLQVALPKKTDAMAKGKSFWEIDMTDFEP
jgi:hypothetical protein